MDWNYLRAFVAAARAGSLSAAAHELGMSQPTVSRYIQALEKELQIQLFQRSTQGLILTSAGADLLGSAQNMNEAADQFQRQVLGLRGQISGSVRISANEVIGLYLLPPALAAFQQQYPELQIEVLIDNRASSLNKREADLALRMFRPTQLNLKARRLPDLALGFFAHQDYLQAFSRPQNLAELAQHRLIGFDEDWQMIAAAGQLGLEMQRDNFVLRCDHLAFHIQALRSAAGIAVTHCGLARIWSDLKPVLPELALPALEFWLVSHVDTQYAEAIRLLSAFLADWFTPDPYHAVQMI